MQVKGFECATFSAYQVSSESTWVIAQGLIRVIFKDMDPVGWQPGLAIGMASSVTSARTVWARE
jgi:hypothetical protein